MGMFDQMKNQVIGGAIGHMMGGQNSPLITALIQLVMNNGGLGGLQNQFQKQGMGNLINSWISPGPNQPIGPQQVESAFGTQQLNDVSRDTGVPYQELTSGLSQFLPSLVDRLTPNGQMPSQPLDASQLMQAGLSMFQQKSH